MKPSAEQQKIIDSIETHNIICNSVAGSGKTTTVVYIAERYAAKRILLITYNKKLKIETRQRLAARKLENVEVHSYHSFAVNYYCRTAYRDSGIIEALGTDVLLPPRDIIVIDEAQDMNPLYFQLARKIIAASGRPRILIVGDFRQSIYDFNGADERFITLAPQLFGGDNWLQLKLSVSFRINNEMADFVNAMIGEQFIGAAKTGEKPHYLIGDYFRESKRLIDLIRGRRNDEIFVIAPSVKSEKSPVRRFANTLTKKGYPVFVPSNDDQELDEELLAGKIVFSSFHQVKGLERNVVIMFGFDKSYFDFFARGKSPKLCPNTLYVAATRAKERLIICHQSNNEYIPFMTPEEIARTCIVSGKLREIKLGGYEKSVYSASQLCDKIPSVDLAELMKMIAVTEVERGGQKITIPAKIKQGNLFESVADINGVAIVSYIEWAKYGRLAIFEQRQSYMGLEFGKMKLMTAAKQTMTFPGSAPYLSMLGRLAIDGVAKIEIADILMLANIWNSYLNCVSFKLAQIRDYTWLDAATMKKFECRFAGFGAKTAFERGINISLAGEFGRDKEMIGSIDAIDGDDLYEFKCVAEFEDEHVLQLALYYFATGGKYKNYYLYNLLDGRKWRIEIADMRALIEKLCEIKFAPKKDLTNEEFVAKMNAGEVAAAEEFIVDEGGGEIDNSDLLADLESLKLNNN